MDLIFSKEYLINEFYFFFDICIAMKRVCCSFLFTHMYVSPQLPCKQAAIDSYRPYARKAI